MADFPGAQRALAFSFVIGNYAYVGGGFGPYPQQGLSDVWEYDQQANSWTQKLDFPGVYRTAAMSFAIGGKGYSGLGIDTNGAFKDDVWQYDPLTDGWTQKADFPGEARYYQASFV